MASGHVNRIKRPDTWLHRPMLQNVKKVLANPEPSTHGTSRHFRAPRNLVAAGAQRTLVKRHQSRAGGLRVTANLLNRLRLMLPVQSRRKKYFASGVGQITFTIRAFCSSKGRFAIVTNAGRNAVDVDALEDERR